MTISTGFLILLGTVDIVLLLVSYLTYDRIRRLQEAYGSRLL
jgi:hypothetical protein